MSEFLRPIPELHVGKGSAIVDPRTEESYRVRRVCQELAHGDKNRASDLWNEWRDAGSPPFSEWNLTRRRLDAANPSA